LCLPGAPPERILIPCQFFFFHLLSK
jgi:hypothetical protein